MQFPDLKLGVVADTLNAQASAFQLTANCCSDIMCRVQKVQFLRKWKGVAALPQRRFGHMDEEEAGEWQAACVRVPRKREPHFKASLRKAQVYSYIYLHRGSTSLTLACTCSTAFTCLTIKAHRWPACIDHMWLIARDSELMLYYFWNYALFFTELCIKMLYFLARMLYFKSYVNSSRRVKFE